MKKTKAIVLLNISMMLAACSYEVKDDNMSSSGVEELSSSSGFVEPNSSSGFTEPNLSSGESKEEGTFKDNTFIDPRDGKAYKYSTAANGQIWMIENLNYSRDNTLGYCYGIDINGENPHRASPTCDNGYGRFYSWETAMDGNFPQGLCPYGWHVPSVEEFEALLGLSQMPKGFNSIAAGSYNLNPDWGTLGWKEKDIAAFYWKNNAANNNFYFPIRCVAPRPSSSSKTIRPMLSLSATKPSSSSSININ